MVRGSAALLAAVLYFVFGDALPGGSATAAGVCGALAVALCAYALVPARGEAAGLLVLGIGAALLAVALNGQDVGAEATPVEILFAAAAGLLFALGFSVPAAVVALPVVVAGIDAATLLGGGADAVRASGGAAEILTLDLPAWGDDDVVPRLSFLDATFLALFAAWSADYGLRPRVVLPLMAVALAGAVALTIALERSVPTLPFLAVAFLLPVADRIPHLLRSEG